jgi:hypothetical protein
MTVPTTANEIPAAPSPTTIADKGDRIPGEFLGFWERVDGRRVRRARDACRRLLRFDPIPDEAHVRAFAHGYYDADPVAEAFVDELYLSRGANEGRRVLDQAIAHGVDSVTDAPDSMRRLFDEFERPPEWLDRDLVERGAALFRRYGPAVFSFAGVETLLGYTESSIVKPLAFTGTYSGDTALNRFMETARFLDRRIRARRAGARRRGPWDRDAGADHARLPPPASARSPRLGPRSVGRADQPVRRADHVDVLQPHTGTGDAPDGIPHLDPRDRGDDALLALHRAPTRSPAPLVSRDGPGLGTRSPVCRRC